MSLINHIPKLETEGHWDSELIGTSIRFPKTPELWTEDELSALYSANGLDADDSNSRIQKAQKYWRKMLAARAEQIERDVTFNSRPVRAECALEQPLNVLAAGIDYSHADAFLASDAILTLLADIQQDTSKQTPALDRYSDTEKPRTIANNISELIEAKMAGIQCRMFGIRLVSLANNRFEIALPSLSIQFVMNQANYERTIMVFEAAADMALTVLQSRIALIVSDKEQFIGGKCDVGIALNDNNFFTGVSSAKGTKIRGVDAMPNAEQRRDALALGGERLGNLLVLSTQGDDLLLADLLHDTLVSDYMAIGLLKHFIKEHYTIENYGSLPDFESVVASEPQAKALLQKITDSDGSAIYTVSYNDITSNRLVVKTDDWLFALKVYRGHAEINGNMRLGMVVN